MPSLDLAGAWEVLGTEREASGIAVVPTGVTVRAGEVLAGVDSENRRHLLIPLGPGEAARTSTRGQAVHIARVAHNGQSYLTVFCLLPNLHGVFTQFCGELLFSIHDAGSPAREAMEAYERWRTLFSDASLGRGLTDEALIGLIGEMLVVEMCLVAGCPGDLDYWVGPFGAVHDLRTVGQALEVKTTLSREGCIVPISSIDQLTQPSEAALHLVHLRLEPDPAGLNLESLVKRLVEAGASLSEIARRLMELGGSIDELDQYTGRRFRQTSLRFYDVDGFAFPRITRASFESGDLPPGTLHLRYSIDLTNEPPCPLDSKGQDQVLSDFTKGATHAVDS